MKKLVTKFLLPVLASMALLICLGGVADAATPTNTQLTFSYNGCSLHASYGQVYGVVALAKIYDLSSGCYHNGYTKVRVVTYDSGNWDGLTCADNWSYTFNDGTCSNSSGVEQASITYKTVFGAEFTLCVNTYQGVDCHTFSVAIV